MDKFRKKQLKDEKSAIQGAILRQIRAAYEPGFDNDEASNAICNTRLCRVKQLGLNYTSACFAIAIIIGITGLIFECIAFNQDVKWDETLAGVNVLPKIPNENVFGGNTLKSNQTQINKALLLLQRISFIDPMFIAFAVVYLLIIIIHLFFYSIDSRVRRNLMLVDGIYIIGGFLFFILTTILGTKVASESDGYFKAAKEFSRISKKTDLHLAVGHGIRSLNMEENDKSGYYNVKHMATILKHICLICAKDLSELNDNQLRSLKGMSDSFGIKNHTFVYTYSSLLQLGFCQDSSDRNVAFGIFITLAFVCWAIPCVPCILDPDIRTNPTITKGQVQIRNRKEPLGVAKKYSSHKNPVFHSVSQKTEFDNESNPNGMAAVHGLGCGNTNVVPSNIPSLPINPSGLKDETPVVNEAVEADPLPLKQVEGQERLQDKTEVTTDANKNSAENELAEVVDASILRALSFILVEKEGVKALKGAKRKIKKGEISHHEAI